MSHTSCLSTKSCIAVNQKKQNIWNSGTSTITSLLKTKTIYTEYVIAHDIKTCSQLRCRGMDKRPDDENYIFLFIVRTKKRKPWSVDWKYMWMSWSKQNGTLNKTEKLSLIPNFQCIAGCNEKWFRSDTEIPKYGFLRPHVQQSESSAQKKVQHFLS